MSIILDALKRSDRERRLQKPPDLSQIYQENHPPRRNPMIWILLIVVVLVGGIAGAYLFFQRNPEIENTKRPEKAIVTAGKKTPPEKQKSLRNFSAKPGVPQQFKKRKVLEMFPKRVLRRFPHGAGRNPRKISRTQTLYLHRIRALMKGEGIFSMQYWPKGLRRRKKWRRIAGGILKEGSEFSWAFFNEA